MIFSASKNRWIDFIKLLESEKIIFSTYRISQPWATIKQQLYSSNNMETPINLSWNYTADGSIRVNIASNVHESTWKQNLSSLDFMRNKTPTKSIKRVSISRYHRHYNCNEGYQWFASAKNGTSRWCHHNEQWVSSLGCTAIAHKIAHQFARCLNLQEKLQKKR